MFRLFVRAFSSSKALFRYDSAKLIIFSDYRTHSVKSLQHLNEGASVKVSGWVTSIRKINQNFGFLMLHDTVDDKVQVFLEASKVPQFEDFIRGNVNLEAVVSIEGILKYRPKKDQRTDCPMGMYELSATTLELLNNVPKPLPFSSFDVPSSTLPLEDFRASCRYLDLRRQPIHHIILYRGAVNHQIRSYLIDRSFVEIETPLLFRKTSEGAAEFPVPFTDSSGNVWEYSLPQSPQQFKQMLMVAGFSRYFQLARCFRNEQLTADRQPEFTQLDIEMSFVSFEDVKDIIEGLLIELWRKRYDSSISLCFPVLTYDEVMRMYGCDKPDLRFIEPRIDILDEASSVVRERISLDFERPQDIEIFEKFLNSLHNIPDHANEVIDYSTTRSGLKVIIESSRPTKIYSGWTLSGRLRTYYIDNILLPKNPCLKAVYKFLWVINFPLFSGKKCPTSTRVSFESMHHPFTSATTNLSQAIAAFSNNPEDPAPILDLVGNHYDLVCNGCEVGGGSVRIHDSVTQRSVFKDILMLGDKEIAEFNHLLNALASGAPPHAGIALGMDRLIALLCQTDSIRDTIAFPKYSYGIDPTTNSPALRSPVFK